MSFANGCACHVWALDGWVNDMLAHEVNENYANSGTAIMLGGAPPGGLNGRITRLLGDCRITPTVAQAGVLYGGFSNVGDATPEHMWFEHNGYVYDTMPGAPIRRLAATAQTRLRPPSETNAFANARVGSIAFSLSETQHRIISDGTIVWVTQVVAGRNVDTYLPPN